MSPHQSIAHYRITGKLGEGGMGAVYRATDTKLNREVAIKVLPDTFAADPDRLARFTREAHVLAQLNHPNIAAIYGVEDRALVMELIEGPAPSGPLSAEEVLPLLHQLIDALEYAHDKGVVHRDLKPANLKLTSDGRLKVLDFGLAKALTNDPAATANPADSPTLTMRATMAGVIMGTAAYMSPEQARGHNADRRSDIWSFGVVVYELLTGKQLFNGPTVSDVLAAVLTQTPDLSAVPPRFHRLLKMCLARDPNQRLSHISGARLLLDDPVRETAPSASSRTPWIVSAALLAACGALALVHFRETPPPAEVVRFQVPAPEGGSFAATKIAVSREGRKLAFVAYTKSQPQGVIWVRSLDNAEPHFLPGTEGAVFPFWSPDGRSIGFWSRGSLRRVDVNGGPVQILCDTTKLSPTGNSAGVWDTNGTIVFPVGAAGLYRIPDKGGTPVRFLEPDHVKEGSYFFPVSLADGRHLLYHLQASSPRMIWSSLDGKERKDLGPSGFSFGYAPPASRRAPGHLLFVQQSALIAQPVEPDTFSPVGSSFRVADHVATGTASAAFDVSPDGMLAYRRGYSVQNQQLLWVDRSGKTLSTIGAMSDYVNVALSRDAARLLVTQTVASEEVRSLWLFDLARGVPSRFTLDTEGATAGVFSPDARKVAYSSSGAILIKDAGGGGAAQTISGGPVLFSRISDWSLDGRYLMHTQGATGNSQIWIVDLAAAPGERRAVRYSEEGQNISLGQFSPESTGPPRWIAYTSAESGQRPEIYIQSFPSGGGKFQISNGGGSQARWRRDGKELFYIASDGRLMAVDIKLSPQFQAGIPHALFESPARQVFSGIAFQYDVAPDGQRFLFNAPRLETGSQEVINVELNWLAGVKK